MILNFELLVSRFDNGVDICDSTELTAYFAGVLEGLGMEILDMTRYDDAGGFMCKGSDTSVKCLNHFLKGTDFVYKMKYTYLIRLEES